MASTYTVVWIDIRVFRIRTIYNNIWWQVDDLHIHTTMVFYVVMREPIALDVCATDITNCTIAIGAWSWIAGT